MYQHCMNSDTNIVTWHAFLKESVSLQKLKSKAVFQAKHIVQVDKDNGV